MLDGAPQQVVHDFAHTGGVEDQRRLEAELGVKGYLNHLPDWRRVGATMTEVLQGKPQTRR
ncbi:MAG: hypothetical protein ACKV22_33510 [Bryobacteraceae bacterium]